MIYEKINLKESYPFLKNDVELEAYCQENYPENGMTRKRKTILVIPGGAYQFVSNREASPIATRLLGHNINAFVLHYSCGEAIEFPNPLIEAYAAIDFIKKNAKKYSVDVDSIGVIGFSAGGNLAGNVAAHYNEEIFLKAFNCKKDYLKVSGLLLGYPVVDRDPSYAHLGSFINVSKGDEKIMDYYCFANYIDKNFPQTFIWHTCFDNAVPVKNSTVLATKLAENKVKFELHIDTLGDHGQSLADKSVYEDDIAKLVVNNRYWFDKLIKFVEDNL